MGVCDEDAPRAVRDVVANDLCVHGFRAYHEYPCKTGTAHIVGEDLGPGGVLFDEHANLVAYEIIPRDDSGIDAFLNIDGVSVFRVASDNIVHDLGVAGIAPDTDAFGDGFGAAYNMVLRNSGVDTLAKGHPASDIAYDMVSHNSSVASGVNVDHERLVAPLPFNLEAPDREPRYAHIANARPGELAGVDIEVAPDANSLRSDKPRAGRVCFGSGGRVDHGVVSAQLYPILADYYVLSVNSPHHDSVARMGSVYGLLDRLARPNDRALRSGGADPRRQCHPTCHQHGQSHGGQQHYGASHRKTRLPSVRGGVRCDEACLTASLCQ